MSRPRTTPPSGEGSLFALLTLRRRRLGERVDVTTQKTFKFFPKNPPRKGEIVLVDDVRSRVTRVKVRWDERQWTLLDLWAKPDPKEQS